MRTFRFFLLLSLAAGAWAKKPKDANKKMTVEPEQDGANSEEGWIIQHTSHGIVKVRRKQNFKFQGSELSAGVARPSQTVLGQRPIYRKTTLIPERSSFRREFFEASGYAASGR